MAVQRSSGVDTMFDMLRRRGCIAPRVQRIDLIPAPVPEYRKVLRMGFVVAITNPAWPDHVLLTGCGQPLDELAYWQRADPDEGFILEAVISVHDRRRVLSFIQERIGKPYVNDWFKVPLAEVVAVMGDAKWMLA